MFLTNGNIALRDMKSSDSEHLLRWLTDPQVLEFYGGRDQNYTPERIRQKYFQDSNEVMRLILEHEDRPIGYMQVYKVGSEALIQEYQYPYPNRLVYASDQFIGEPELWGKGIGKQMLLLLRRHLIHTAKADALLLDPHTVNVRAIRCYQSCGYRILKTLSAHEMHEGTRRDCYLMEYTFE